MHVAKATLFATVVAAAGRLYLPVVPQRGSKSSTAVQRDISSPFFLLRRDCETCDGHCLSYNSFCCDGEYACKTGESCQGGTCCDTGGDPDATCDDSQPGSCRPGEEKCGSQGCMDTGRVCCPNGTSCPSGTTCDGEYCSYGSSSSGGSGSSASDDSGSSSSNGAIASINGGFASRAAAALAAIVAVVL